MAYESVNRDKEKYLDEWAELMITYWVERMDAEMVGVSERSDGTPRLSCVELRRSFTVAVMKQAGGDTAKIDHMFKHYGMYLDGGVFPGS